MCTKKNRRVRRAFNQWSRNFVNHYNKVESNYSTVYNCGSSTKYKKAEQAADDVEQPEVESVEFMETTHQSTRVESESCTVDSGTGWSILKYAAIFGGVVLGLYLMTNRDK